MMIQNWYSPAPNRAPNYGGLNLGAQLIANKPEIVVNWKRRRFGLLNAPFPDGCVLVAFDSKKKGEPRLGIIHSSGEIDVVKRGDSRVLKAMDLESISLIDHARGQYAAADSLGMLFIFQLVRDHHGWLVKAIREVQLPVPYPEKIKHTEKLRTNIEAMRIYQDPPTGSLVISWAGRGGSDYLGGHHNTPYIWIRTCPFDANRCKPIFEDTREGRVHNTTGDPEWRAISDLDVLGTTAYFATCVDREEADPLKHGDTRESLMRQGRKLFDSQIVRTDLVSGQSDIVARIPYVKVEALMVHPAAPDRIWWGSDDEGLGCLVGEVYSGDIMDPTRAAMQRWRVPASAFGLSGMAAGPTLGMDGMVAPTHRIPQYPTTPQQHYSPTHMAPGTPTTVTRTPSPPPHMPTTPTHMNAFPTYSPTPAGFSPKSPYGDDHHPGSPHLPSNMLASPQQRQRRPSAIYLRGQQQAPTMHYQPRSTTPNRNHMRYNAQTPFMYETNNNVYGSPNNYASPTNYGSPSGFYDLHAAPRRTATPVRTFSSPGYGYPQSPPGGHVHSPVHMYSTPTQVIPTW